MHPDPGGGRVAAIIPVYRARYLADALESVFFQSRQPDEVIVIDDGSPDRELLQRAVAPYAGRVRMLHQENRGAGAARNSGLGATSAELVAFLDADDRWLPHFLREQTAVFASNPRIDVAYTDGLFIGRSALAGRRFMAECPSCTEVTAETLLAQRSTVLLSAVLARRARILAVGGFDASLRRGQDFDLWIRMALAGAVLTSRPSVLALRRLHGANLSGTAIDDTERPIRVLEKALGTMRLTERERLAAADRLRVLRAQLARERGKDLLRRGELGAARRALVEAARGMRTWKLQAAIVAMHIAPWVVRRVYLSREAATSAI